MALAVNSHILLDVHEPKKNRVIATGAPTVGASEIAIWLPTFTPLNKPQFVAGVMDMLHVKAQSVLKDGPTTLHVQPIPASSAAIVVDGTPDNFIDVVLYLGADVRTKAQSHFLERTYKRIREVFLEETKNQG